VVRYHPHYDGDKQLAEHTDASTVTFNVCLVPHNDTARNILYFKDRRHDDYYFSNDENDFVDGSSEKTDKKTFVALHEPGTALVHLGQHAHGVSPVSGERSNLVVWLYGHDGYVRVAPYSDKETLQNEREWNRIHGWKRSSNNRDQQT